MGSGRAPESIKLTYYQLIERREESKHQRFRVFKREFFNLINQPRFFANNFTLQVRLILK